MTGIVFIILRIILVGAILVGMIIILLGINHFSTQPDEEERSSTDSLRDEVNNSPEVVSKHSLFHKFIPGTENIAGKNGRLRK